MNQLELPQRMASLPRDKHGRPVPWFVAFIDGVPDFRIIRAHGITEAVHGQLCWVCGQRMGSWSAFVIGPMCAVNRVSSEPPSHRDCAIYSARACPFLATPAMVRRDRHLPEDRVNPAGISIPRNPGVALVWVTRKWSIFPDPDGHPLFDIGEPSEALWYAHGRDATRDEVRASIDSGLPILQESADAEGGRAPQQLAVQLAAALRWIPRGVAAYDCDRPICTCTAPGPDCCAVQLAHQISPPPPPMPNTVAVRTFVHDLPAEEC